METIRREVKENKGYFHNKWGGLIQFRHQKKPRVAYGETEQEVNQKLDQYAEHEQATQEAAAKRRAENRAARAQGAEEARKNLKVGDIFVASWGYEQTNVDFYQVTKIIGKLAEVRAIKSQLQPHDGSGYSSMSGRSVPCPNEFIGEPQKKVIQSDYKKNPCFRLNSYSSAYLWDGTPMYTSWYA